ncbi:MAG: PKD domain-containing protein [Bacteroidia bacterium]
MKKKYILSIAIMLTKLAVSANVLLKTDTIKSCSTKEKINLSQFVFSNVSDFDFKGNGVLVEQSNYFFDAKNSKTGEYKLSISATVSGANHTEFLVIRHFEKPHVSTGKYDSLCIDAASIQLNKQTPSGNTGKWFYRGTLKNKWDSSINTTFTPSAFNIGTHYFTYVYTVSGTQCRDTAHTSITVNPLPNPKSLTVWNQNNNKNTICMTDKKKLIGNTIEKGAGYIDWTWSGKGCRALARNNYEFNARYSGLGQHTLTYSVKSIYGCSNSITFNVTVEEPAKVNFNYKQNGDTIEFTNLTPNANHFEWHFDDGNMSTDKHARHTFADTGSYWVQLHSTDNQFSNGNSCPDKIMVKKVEYHSTGILELQPSMHIYPSLVTKNLTVDLNALEFVKIEIINLNGKSLLNETINQNKTIDFSAFDKGPYLVRVLNSKNEFTVYRIIRI